MGRPPLKSDDDTKRVTITAPTDWARRIDDWRRKQADLPNLSEAIRRLCVIGAARETHRRYVPTIMIRAGPMEDHW